MGCSTPRASAVRVYLLDDHELLRRGVREVLDAAEGIEVVGESGSAREAVRRIPALRPDVMVLDVRLADGSGIEVCRQVRERDPTIHALMVTTYDDRSARLSAALAGAAGFVLKQISSDDLVAAVRRVAAGDVLLEHREREEAVRQVTTEQARLDLLTRQELRVLELLAEGLTNRRIGERLGIREKTVKNHVTNLLLKLGMERRTQAAVFLTRHATRRAGARAHDRDGTADRPARQPPGRDL